MKKVIFGLLSVISIAVIILVGFILNDQSNADGTALIPPFESETASLSQSDTPPEFWGCRQDIKVDVNKDFAKENGFNILRPDKPNIAICISRDAGNICTPKIDKGLAHCKDSLTCLWKAAPLPNDNLDIKVEIVNILPYRSEIIDYGNCDVRQGKCELRNATITFSAPSGQRYPEDEVIDLMMKRHVTVEAGASMGAGVLIDSQSVLTAWHVIKDEQKHIIVNSPLITDGPLVVAEIRRPFANVDMAILTLGTPILGVEPLEMVDHPDVLKAGAQGTAAVRFIAVGFTRSYLTDKLEVKCANPVGSFQVYPDREGIEHQYNSDWISKPGMSGSGVYTANGELIGVHVAGKERGTKQTDGSVSGGYNHTMSFAPNPDLAQSLGATPN